MHEGRERMRKPRINTVNTHCKQHGRGKHSLLWIHGKYKMKNMSATPAEEIPARGQLTDADSPGNIRVQLNLIKGELHVFSDFD